MNGQRWEPDRIVKPRKPCTNANRKILVVRDTTYLYEDGETGDREDISVTLSSCEPLIVIPYPNPPAFIGWMDERWNTDPAWQFSVSTVKRELYDSTRPSTRKVFSRVTIVNFFGWNYYKTTNRNRPNLYHLCIHPSSFSDTTLEDTSLMGLLRWGMELRDFCVTNQINLRPTQGGTARQFLRDSRFYPEARRKVPKATNEKLRPRLVGNYYHKTVVDNIPCNATYLDQRRSHHYHASKIDFPHSDSLRAFGNFHLVENEDERKLWKKNPERVKEFVNRFHGVMLCKLRWLPSRRKNIPFVPSYLSSPFERYRAFVYTSELPLLDAVGAEIIGIYAAWGSNTRENGLNDYAKWALAELDREPLTWKKSLLLSTYGVLATTPRQRHFAFKRSDKGVEGELLYGSGVSVKMFSTKRETEPATNNVLHRGMIEAACRTSVFIFANELHQMGYNVLQVYADAVIVEGHHNFNWLEKPWRVDAELTEFVVLSANAFTSREVSKIPGGELVRRKYAERAKARAKRYFDFDRMIS